MAEGNFKIVGVLALGTAAVYVGTYLLQRTRERMARRWYRAPGRIVESRIESHVDDYSALVRYTYSVGEKSYFGTRLGFDSLTRTTREQALERLRPYSVGQEVFVHFNPEDPSDAVLEPTVTESETRFFQWIIPLLLAAGWLAWSLC